MGAQRAESRNNSFRKVGKKAKWKRDCTAVSFQGPPRIFKVLLCSTYSIHYALRQALGAAILFVDLWSALPLVALPGPLCPHCIWRMLGALPALGGSANCLSTHQIVMSFVFDMLDVQNEPNHHHPLHPAYAPRSCIMHVTKLPKKQEINAQIRQHIIKSGLKEYQDFLSARVFHSPTSFLFFAKIFPAA